MNPFRDELSPPSSPAIVPDVFALGQNTYPEGTAPVIPAPSIVGAAHLRSALESTPPRRTSRQSSGYIPSPLKSGSPLRLSSTTSPMRAGSTTRSGSDMFVALVSFLQKVHPQQLVHSITLLLASSPSLRLMDLQSLHLEDESGTDSPIRDRPPRSASRRLLMVTPTAVKITSAPSSGLYVFPRLVARCYF
jgi:hypothetical protein